MVRRISACCAGLALVVVAFSPGGCARVGNPAPSARERLEDRLRSEGRMLVAIDYGVPTDSSARGVLFNRDVVLRTPLYIRHRHEPDAYLLLSGEGDIERTGVPVGRLDTDGELLVLRDRSLLVVDGRPLIDDLADWDVFWLSTDGGRPATRDRLYPEVAFTDHFMRDRLGTEASRPVSGEWRLNQHGGGMPTSDRQTQSHAVQRAVNPFSVIGEGPGKLEFGAGDWFNYRAEASVYFGLPRQGNVVDIDTLPDEMRMMIGQGTDDGPGAIFGWDGERGAFVLAFREHAAEPWIELARYDRNRPPLSNWMRLGLELEAGLFARGYVDGAALVDARLPRQVAGPAFMLVGESPVGVDDLGAWSLPRSPSSGTPIFVQSRQFADKQEKAGSDPPQFGQWARGSDTFLELPVSGGLDGSIRGTMLVSRLPLMGGFRYTSRAFADNAGRLPFGRYEIRLYSAPRDATQPPTATPPVFSLPAMYDPRGWTFPAAADASLSAAAPEAQLVVARHADERLYLLRQGEWEPLGAGVAGACHVAVVQWGAAKSPPPSAPSPRHHEVACENWVNELFEEAPVAWNWIEGAFRMDSRWACQDEWNFMACGSPGIPYMTSKNTFHGDQTHEYFITIRPVYPWDAGDERFAYDPSNDPGWAIFQQHNGWYNRRDLNFSFCTDGRNPLSGYAIVFAGDDNTETRLLRHGRVVARNDQARFLIPTGDGHHVVHWEWWKFTVHRRGDRIQVFVNDVPLFDYRDPQPLSGGHVGFWSVRNGFSLTKVVHVAERLGRNPQVLYVETDDPGLPWQSLPKDAARLVRSATPGMVDVERQVGGGFFALRHRPASPVELRRTPVLDMPFELGPGTSVNLHVAIDNRSYIVRVNAPLTGMKSLLAPEFERGECFQLPTMSLRQVEDERYLGDAQLVEGRLVVDFSRTVDERLGASASAELTLITLGNTSNDAYMLAGGKGLNLAGARLRVGTPRFRKRDE